MENSNTARLIEALELQNSLLRQVNARHGLTAVPSADRAPPAALVSHSPVSERNLFSANALKNDLRFRNFCRPRLAGKPPTPEERWKAQTKARQAEFKASCRPKGVYSILKDGGYWTGRLVRIGVKSAQSGEPDWYTTKPESAKLKKIAGEWISQVEDYSEETLVETVSQRSIS